MYSLLQEVRRVIPSPQDFQWERVTDDDSNFVAAPVGDVEDQDIGDDLAWWMNSPNIQMGRYGFIH